MAHLVKSLIEEIWLLMMKFGRRNLKKMLRQYNGQLVISKNVWCMFDSDSDKEDPKDENPGNQISIIQRALEEVRWTSKGAVSVGREDGWQNRFDFLRCIYLWAEEQNLGEQNSDWSKSRDSCPYWFHCSGWPHWHGPVADQLLPRVEHLNEDR